MFEEALRACRAAGRAPWERLETYIAVCARRGLRDVPSSLTFAIQP